MAIVLHTVSARYLTPVAAAMLVGFFAHGAHAVDLQLYTEEAPPISFDRAGEAAGIAVDLVREIQRRVGDGNAIRVVPWARAYHVALYEPNVAIFQVVRTPNRDDLFQWVGPLHQFTAQIFVKAGSEDQVESLDEARYLPAIGVLRDSYLDHEMTRRGFTNLDRAPSLALMMQKFMSGRTPFIAADRGILHGYFMSNPDARTQMKVACTVASLSDYIAFSRITPVEIVSAWQAALDSMKNDGTFARLYLSKFPLD